MENCSSGLAGELMQGGATNPTSVNSVLFTKPWGDVEGDEDQAKLEVKQVWDQDGPLSGR